MVLKPTLPKNHYCVAFENDVKMYGTQTKIDKDTGKSLFENDVKMYGTQTNWNTVDLNALFENDVKMYGTKTTKSAESS